MISLEKEDEKFPARRRGRESAQRKFGRFASFMQATRMTESGGDAAHHETIARRLNLLN